MHTFETTNTAVIGRKRPLPAYLGRSWQRLKLKLDIGCLLKQSQGPQSHVCMLRAERNAEEHVSRPRIRPKYIFLYAATLYIVANLLSTSLRHSESSSLALHLL